MLHARHCITQKSETTLVRFAYQVPVFLLTHTAT